MPPVNPVKPLQYKPKSVIETVSDDLVPSNPEAEEYTLSAILNYGECVHTVAPFLKSAHFQNEARGWIYEAMLSIAERGEQPDMMLVADELERMGRLDDVGGRLELRGLYNMPGGSPYTVEAYARRVVEAATKRAVILATKVMGEAAYDAGKSAEEVLEIAQQAILHIKQPTQRGLAHVSHALADWSTYEETGKTKGLDTGFPVLNAILGGLKPGRLYVVGAEPGTGKSALVKDIATACLKRGERVAMFNLEMSRMETVQRFVAAEKRLDLKRMEEDDLTTDEYQLMYQARAAYEAAPLYIDDSGSLTPLELRTKAQREHMVEPLKLIIVDYIQRMSVPGKEGNRVQEVGYISRSLKALAMSLNIPVIAISSFSRAPSQRKKAAGHKFDEPQLSDLRESGDIEFDADTVMLMWRADPDADKKEPGRVNIKIAKQRNGPTGFLQLYFTPACVRFDAVTNQEGE